MVVTIVTATTAITIGIFSAATTISIFTKGAIIVTELGWSVARFGPDTTAIGEARFTFLNSSSNVERVIPFDDASRKL
jgi:hypothetical protein